MLDNIGSHISNFKSSLETMTADASAILEKLTKLCPEVIPQKEDVNTDQADKQETPVAKEYDKYAVTDSTIVYEQYSNGKTFVLNFNDFAVKVNINGVYYTVAAYGYINIK